MDKEDCSRPTETLIMPHVSICIPAYRQVNSLKQALSSIQEQSFEDYEVIISDDSPDDSVEKLLPSFDFGSRLSYYRNDVALGSPENWNAAVAKANGNYIKILHHDDRFAHSEALRNFVQMLDDHPEADFAFGACLAEMPSAKKSRIHRPTEDQISSLRTSPERLFFGNFIGAPSVTIYRNGLGIKYDKRMKWLVDVDFYIRVLKHNPRFVYSDNVLIVITSDAEHQLTKICQDDIQTDFMEHIMLYNKLADKIQDDISNQQVWFRLFEKYEIYSKHDQERLGLRLTQSESELLDPLWIRYQEKRLARTAHRLYARLPIQIKTICSRIRRM